MQPRLASAVIALCVAAAAPRAAAGADHPVQVWGAAGGAASLQHSFSDADVGLSLRPRDGKVELAFDGGALFPNRKTISPPVPAAGGGYTQQDQKLTGHYFRLRCDWLHPFEKPAVTWRVGAGFAAYQLTLETFNNEHLPASEFRGSDSADFMRVEPLLETGLAKAFRDDLELQAGFQYVFERDRLGRERMRYGGASLTLRLAYRLY